jgi:hypothetical protein
VEPAVGAVDVGARRDDGAFGHILEAEHAPSFFTPEGAHVDDDLRLQVAQLGQVPVEVVEVTVNVTPTGGQRVLVLASMEEGDVVTSLEQLTNGERPRELGTAEKEDPH